MNTQIYTLMDLVIFVKDSKKKLATIFPELIQNNYSVEIKQMRNKYADIQRIGERNYHIRFAKNWIENNPPIEHLQTTIFHEILHSCKGCMNHGRIWKTYADKINKIYHTNISRTSIYEEAPYEPPKVNYEIFCPNCDKIIATRNRLSRTIANGHVRCATCGCDNLRIFKK